MNVISRAIPCAARNWRQQATEGGIIAQRLARHGQTFIKWRDAVGADEKIEHHAGRGVDGDERARSESGIAGFETEGVIGHALNADRNFRADAKTRAPGKIKKAIRHRHGFDVI